MLEVLSNNHYDKILDLFEKTNSTIKIISPFISEPLAKKLCDCVKCKPEMKCTFITRFYLEDMMAKANSLTAIRMMMSAGIQVYALKGLHTKLYLFDDTDAILGSANFTASGFKSNIELSLYFNNEDNMLNELNIYFDDLLQKMLLCSQNIITEKILDETQKKYDMLLSLKKQETTTNKTYSIYMFGASIDKKTNFASTEECIKEIKQTVNENDIVNEMFKDYNKAEQICFNHTIWLKFDGESNNRLEADEGFPMTDVILNGKTIYISNYPQKPSSIQDNDEIYIAALTTDLKGKNQPVIVGRGILQAFNAANVAKKEWMNKYGWMSRYPWYVIIKQCEILDTTVNHGIPLDSVWDVLGSDTYISSFGLNETIADVSKKHYQKAHIRLSGNAKKFIDEKFNMLKEAHGVIMYYSE